MAKKTRQTAPAAQTVGTAALALAPGTEETKAKVLAVLPTLTQEVNELKVTDDKSYQYADALLGRIIASKKVWAPVWERLMEKTVQPIRSGLENLYAMNREIEKPHDALETKVKDIMKEFKTEEARQIAEANRKRDEEAARLQREADEKLRQAQQARTPQLKGRLEASAQRITEAATAVVEREAPQRVMGKASSTRTKKIPSVPDRKPFLRGILSGAIPDDCWVIDAKRLVEYYKEEPDVVKEWPGVVIIDDITIVGRG